MATQTRRKQAKSKVSKKNSRARQTRSQSTRKARGASVLNVTSPSTVKAFEKILSRGPLTLVYVNAKWCGACHKFTNDVWSPLSQMKNKTINMASVDSEMIDKTSLSKVPRKFFPTLMLVGKDKQPAVFKDEDGLPTNAMPRKNTLSEDKDSLSTLLRSMNVTKQEPSKTLPSSVAIKMNSRNSPPRASMTPNNSDEMGKSPFDSTISEPSMEAKREDTPVSRTVKIESTPGLPPDVGSDLVASQKRKDTPYPRGGLPSISVGGSRGGRMLNAIREKAASLKSILNIRKYTTRKSRN